jgi:membrane-associated protein
LRGGKLLFADFADPCTLHEVTWPRFARFRNRFMLRNLPTRQKNILRLLAWGCASAVVLAICQDSALAQGTLGAVVEENPGDAGFLSELISNLFTSRRLMETLGKPQYTIAAFIALNVIVFVETGLLIGFFLPGDSLLVITGLICANESCGWNLPFLLATLSASAILGDSVGYWIGYKTGPKIFSREKSFFFDKDHLLKAQQFYEKHGGKTIILARFVPFLRTFAPVVAGVGEMEYKQFLFFNVFGGVAWVFSMVLAGRFLPDLLNPLLAPIFGEAFNVAEHVEKVVIIVVFLSITPGIFAWLKGKLSGKVAAPELEPGPAKKSQALSAE